MIGLKGPVCDSQTYLPRSESQELLGGVENNAEWQRRAVGVAVNGSWIPLEGKHLKHYKKDLGHMALLTELVARYKLFGKADVFT